jgi:putative ABC transport system permease protein
MSWLAMPGRPPAEGISRASARLCRAVAQRIPLIAADSESPEDVAATVQAICLAAGQRHGRIGAMRAGILEVVSLMSLAIRVRKVSSRSRPAGPGVPSPPRRPSLALSFRLAWKRLVGARTNAALAVITLALGIGLSTAVFSVLDSIVWRPAPYPNADRLVELATANIERKFTFAGFYSPALLSEWRQEKLIFDRVEGYDTPTLPYRADDGQETVAAAVITPGLFSMLGAAPIRGRLFLTGDGRSGTDDVVVVSDAFWRARLHGDPNVIGRLLVIDDRPCHVVGVAPAAFRFPNGRIDAWMPYDIEAPPEGGTGARTLTPVARIAPGLTFDQASRLARERGGSLSRAAGEPASQTAVVFRLSDSLDDKTLHGLWVLAGAVGFLFLVVSANVANLALSRSLQRARDVAVRASLGASPGDLLSEALVENALVAAIGCAAGVVIAWLLTRLAAGTLPVAMTTSAFNPIALNGRATLFAVALGSIAAVVFGLPVAVVASRSSMLGLLGSSSRSATGSVIARRLRATLVVLEVTVCTALLVGAALLTRTFIGLETASRGFDTANLISVRVALPAVGYADANVREHFVSDVLARLRATPGIEVATDGGLPTEVRPIMLGAVDFADRPNQPSGPLIAPLHEVPSAYFAALRIPLVTGRLFRPDDGPDAVIVSDSFAKKFWPSRSAIGARFRSQDREWQTVIGIVGDIRPMTADGWGRGLDLYYQTGKAPVALRPRMSLVSSVADYRTIVVRVNRPADAISLVPQVIHAVDPRVVIWRTARVDDLYTDAIARPRTVFLLMTIFAVAGLLLSMAGIYGVLSHLVSQRLREIGVRLALGARPADVGGLVLRSGVGLAAIGLVTGLGLAVVLTHAMATLVSEVGKPDFASMAVVVTVLLVTAVSASWSPARRAMGVDPVRLLREE